MTASPSDPTSTSAPRFAFVRGDEIAPQALHAAFTAAFSDYLIGPFQIPPAQWPMFLARQGVDLALSRVALDSAETLSSFAQRQGHKLFDVGEITPGDAAHLRDPLGRLFPLPIAGYEHRLTP